MGFRNYLRVATLVTLGLLSSFKSANTDKSREYDPRKIQSVTPYIPINLDEAKKIETYRILVENKESEEARDCIQYATNDINFKVKEDSLKQEIANVSIKASEDFANSTASHLEHSKVNTELRRLHSEIDKLERSHYVLVPYNLTYLQPLPKDTTIAGRTIRGILGRIDPEDALSIKKASKASGVSLEKLIGIFGKETSGYSTAVSTVGAITRAQILPDYAEFIRYATTKEIKNELSDYIEKNSTDSTFIRDLTGDSKLAVYVAANYLSYFDSFFDQDHLTISAYNAGALGSLVAWGLEPENNHGIYRKLMGNKSPEKMSNTYNRLRTDSLERGVKSYFNGVSRISDKFVRLRNKAAS